MEKECGKFICTGIETHDIVLPYRCCVPSCIGNCNKEPKVHIFKFPKKEDLKNIWLQKIKRENFSPIENSRVCSLYVTVAMQACTYSQKFAHKHTHILWVDVLYLV